MNKAKPKIFISCGELSGESHASRVVIELFKLCPEAEIRAFGSEILEELGVKVIKDYQAYSFSGISEVIANASTILSLKEEIASEIIKWQPDIVLLVDYGGFNLQLAKTIKQKSPSIPIIEFIAPQIWASRPWRIGNIKKHIDKVLCTLPLEEKLYEQAGIKHKYVGNPVLDSLAKPITKTEFLKQFNEIQYRRGLANSQNARPNTEVLIGLFPGSRKSEIREMLPIMIQASEELIHKNPEINFRFILAKAPTISKVLLEQCGLKAPLTMAVDGELNHHIELLEAQDMLSSNHKLLSAADALWLCSGTVTLEAALYTTPYFLSYRSNLFNYLLYLIFRTIKMAGLANIISGNYIIKEFLQYDANAKNFVKETEAWLYQQPREMYWTGKFSQYYHKIKTDLSELKSKLSGYNTAQLVANEILEGL